MANGDDTEPVVNETGAAPKASESDVARPQSFQSDWSDQSKHREALDTISQAQNEVSTGYRRIGSTLNCRIL